MFIAFRIKPVGIETLPKTLDDLDLFLGESSKSRIDFLEVTHISEQLVGIHEVLVNIIEVRKEHVTPKDKLIESLAFATRAQTIVDAVEVKELCCAIDDMTSTEKTEEFIDGRDRWHTTRYLLFPSIVLIKNVLQMTCEEKAAASIGKAKQIS